MADPQITTSEDLRIETYFVDGDTRTFTLKNPKAQIAESDIASINSMIQTNNLLIGDKTGATFGKITSATRVTKTTINYSSDTINE